MKQMSEEAQIKNFRDYPKIFYVYYIVMSKGEPTFEKLVNDEKSLSELLSYKSLYANKHHDDHKYNLTKNAFWDRCGFNTFMKENLKF